MTGAFTEQELMTMEATAKAFYDMCRRARLKLRPVSTGSSKKTILSETDAANIRINRRKRLLKSSK